MNIKINNTTIEASSSLLIEEGEYIKINSGELYDYLQNNWSDIFNDKNYIEVNIEGQSNYYIMGVEDNWYDNIYFYLIHLDGNSTLDRVENEILSNDFIYTHDSHVINAEDNSDFNECSNCGEYYHYEDMIYTDEGDYYCNRCDDQYFYCDECDRYFSHDRTEEHYDPNEDRVYCEDCWEEHGGEDHLDYQTQDTSRADIVGDIESTTPYYSPVSGYHNYYRSFIFRSLANETEPKLFFGTELEVENNGDYNTDKVASYVLNNLNCITAEDGSLNNGFEIISDPQTIGYWLSRKDKIAAVFKELTDNGIRSDETSTCGLHIHISREGLGETIEEQENTISKMELIIENFKEQMKAFSRRKDFYWCSFLSDITNIELSTDDIKNKKPIEHRSALNIEHSKTVEVRIFKGTLNPTTFFASLELVSNIVELAKSGEHEGKSWSYLVKMNNYEELQSYVKTREIITALKIKDHTLKLREKRIKQDKKMIALKEKQKAILNDFINYNIKNIYILNQIKMIKNNYLLSNIMSLDLKRQIGAMLDIIGSIDRLSEDIGFACYKTYTTLGGETIRLYEMESIQDKIKSYKKLIDQLKNIIEGGE